VGIGLGLSLEEDPTLLMPQKIRCRLLPAGLQATSDHFVENDREIRNRDFYSVAAFPFPTTIQEPAGCSTLKK
jgi:hypothetical protein